MRYFLLGLPGSGKSYWGRLLADKAQLPFIDLDQYIEENEDKTIAEIFSAGGESDFRHLETIYLQKAIEQESHIIIACGGGTPCFNKNMELMNENGITIFLNLPIEQIAERLSASKEIGKRPLFKGQSTSSQIHAKLAELLEARLSYYLKAKKVVVDASESSFPFF